MSLVEKIKSFFSGSSKQKVKSTEAEIAVSKVPDGYEEISQYVEASPEEVELVSVIAAAIFAGDNTNSSLRVKRVLKKNPEIELVSIIAAAGAAGDNPASSFNVKNIYRAKN